MKRSFILILVIGILACMFTACASETETATITEQSEDVVTTEAPLTNSSSEETTFTPLATIEDLEFHTEVINGEPVFWIKNNSEYTLVGILYIKAASVASDEYIAAYAWKDYYAPGETTEVVPFVKITDTYAAKSTAMAEDAIFATTEEVEAAVDITIEFGYQNDIAMENFGYAEGAIDEWVEYNFITNSYRGFSYIETQAELEEALSEWDETGESSDDLKQNTTE